MKIIVNGEEFTVPDHMDRFEAVDGRVVVNGNVVYTSSDGFCEVELFDNGAEGVIEYMEADDSAMLKGFVCLVKEFRSTGHISRWGQVE